MKEVFFISLCTILLTGHVALSANAPKREAEKKWSTLSGCQLVANEFNDGDSFHVKYKGEEFIFRLYFVDAPETEDRYGRLVEQSRSFGLLKANMIPLGKQAKALTEQILGDGFTVITCWEDAEGQSKLPRYFAMIKIGTKYLDQELAKEGLVRIYGIKPHIALPGGLSARGHVRILDRLQDAASKQEKGAWGLVADRELQRVKKKEPAKEKDAKEPAKPTTSLVSDEKININTATEDQLLALPGIGPKSAMLILKSRPFATLADLKNVSGFGTKTVAGLEPFLFAAPAEALPGSGRYVVENVATLRGQTVRVSVIKVVPAEGGAPSGYKKYSASTEVDGVYGGTIPLFIATGLTVQLDGFFKDGTAKPVTGKVYEFGDVVGLTVN